MKELLTTAFLFSAICTVSFSQIGKVGINTTTPAAMLHVMDSSVLFSTTLNTLPGMPGNPPVSGAGIRTFWYPDKAAFRAGRVRGITTPLQERNLLVSVTAILPQGKIQ
ncbi:MAG: hypothetical protein IPP25_18315 [Saprospiraceae bacterium]|nr:hypothetical protein [Candidatus Opimibacter skivensis]